jgi:hypothetical protein
MPVNIQAVLTGRRSKNTVRIDRIDRIDRAAVLVSRCPAL